ncbi:MAG: methyltransferase domain-containing protein [Planctomycetales bacterium]|nr:methyltransferase domain-containing protein [Planctomycetales bacterium]
MRHLERVHQRFVRDRRAQVLARHLASLLPQGARVLDVGCGDGQIAALVKGWRDDIHIEGIDVLVRDDAAVPVQPFDGLTIAGDDNSFDVVTLVDVLHHTDDPRVLLTEARRVASQAVVIKDHLLEGIGAAQTLRWMDRVGNQRHGVHLPFNYWTRAQWQIAFSELELHVEHWIDRLGIYPWPTRHLLERSLHFMARCRPCEAVARSSSVLAQTIE